MHIFALARGATYRVFNSIVGMVEMLFFGLEPARQRKDCCSLKVVKIATEK